MAEFLFSQKYTSIIKDHPTPPPRLYKYRSLRGEAKIFSKSLVTRAEAYFAKPNELNDPYDCRPHNTWESTAAERRAFLAMAIKGIEPGLSRAARRSRIAQMNNTLTSQMQREGFEVAAHAAYTKNLKDTGIFSLSAEPASNLMWSHYGDAHRGICVAFDFVSLNTICPMPMTYSSERPSYNMFRNVVALEELGFLRKSLDWAYEEEWRSVGLWWSGRHVLPEGSLVGVILGAGISNDDRTEVVDWVLDSGRSIEVSQAAFEPKTYRLSFSPVEL
jgi:hypothetical protein